MKQILLFSIFIILNLNALGQTKKAADYGYKHLIYKYNNDNVDILIKSKKGEENIKKPLLFFCQGSLPQPLIKLGDKGAYGIFPFNADNLSSKYHLAIIGKPYIPLISETSSLGNNFAYIDSSGKFPKEYSKRNLLNYYVDRNIQIIQYLQKQEWISKHRLVVAGHSEGSTIASKMALKSKEITHLIYSGGNPMGRIMSIIQQQRANEKDANSKKYAQEEIKYWQFVVENKTDMDDSYGDTNKATFQFSNPPIEYLEKLKIPVLVCYGTKDYSAPFNDFMRIDFIRKSKTNFKFNSYIGTEHNYFPLTNENKPNHKIFNWNKVADNWLEWLNES